MSDNRDLGENKICDSKNDNTLFQGDSNEFEDEESTELINTSALEESSKVNLISAIDTVVMGETNQLLLLLYGIY